MSCVPVTYTLSEMADDAASLLGALGIERAHAVGASTGGMIVQTMALRHPGRLASLTSVMSTTGAPGLPGPTPDAMQVLTTPAPTECDAFVDYQVRTWRVVGSPGFPFDEERIRARPHRLWQRGVHPAGVARQLVAILASGSRREALRRVTTPAVVIHGEDDPLVPFAAGRDTAEAIPGAELVAIRGMGHDMPPGAWPALVDSVEKLASRA